jgi:hypothetical protein
MEMSLWMKIGWAAVLLAMLIFLLPRARQMIVNSPKPGKGDWRGVLIPLAFVVTLVLLLIMAV